jgi:hypothetical protein
MGSFQKLAGKLEGNKRLQGLMDTMIDKAANKIEQKINKL